MSKRLARLLTKDTDYKKLNITNEIKIWEDGHRTNGKIGEYEWWYFDSKLDDGSSLVIIFFTNPITTYGTGYAPYVSFDLKRPDGTYISHECHPLKKDYFFSKDCCDVRIGNSYIKGNLNEYEIHFENDEIKADVKLIGNVPSWRPYSGIIEHGKHYFAWLPSIPEGKVIVNVNLENEILSFTGTGYHDHNWGDTPMFFLMHHWYWGRAKIGDYVVVSSYITANKKYGFAKTPIFMIAKDGKILADEADKCLKYEEIDYNYDPISQKHYAKNIIYNYDDGHTRYVITYTMEETIEAKGMKDLTTKLQYALIMMLGLRGSYHRMGGNVVLEKFENNVLVETVSSKAIWEQMYFGKDVIRNKKNH